MVDFVLYLRSVLLVTGRRVVTVTLITKVHQKGYKLYSPSVSSKIRISECQRGEGQHIDKVFSICFALLAQSILLFRVGDFYILTISGTVFKLIRFKFTVFVISVKNLIL